MSDYRFSRGYVPPFWHCFRGEGLKKLGFRIVDNECDETGEIITFKNNKLYVNPIKLVIDTMTGGFAVYECIYTESGAEKCKPIEVELPVLAAILDLYSEIGLMTGVYNELHNIHKEDSWYD